MNVDEIKNGVVIDHIKAGQAMEIYKFLGLDKFDCTVAIIKNAQSRRMGKKDCVRGKSVFSNWNAKVKAYSGPGESSWH